MSPHRIFIFVWFAALLATGQGDEVLRTVRAIRSLKPVEAAENRRVAIAGVVTYADEIESTSFFIQDEEAGLYVSTPEPWHLKNGQRVAVDGVTGPGDFAPIIHGRVYRDLGAAPMPKPMPARYTDLVGGPADSQFVEVRGVIRSVVPAPSGYLQVDLVTEGHRVSSLLPPDAVIDADALVDSEVRVRGVCITRFYDRRWIAAWMRVQSPAEIVVERPTAVPLASLEPQPAASLLRFDPDGQWLHRVRIRGVVTGTRLQHNVYLRDSAGPAEAVVSLPAKVRVGDELDVVGFVRGNELHPVVEDAIIQKISTQPAPVPHVPELADIFAGKESGNLVTVTGRLVDRMSGLAAQVMVVENDGKLFQAHLPLDAGPQVEWQRGSHLQLTGICVVPLESRQQLRFGFESITFQVLLRSPNDVVVTELPPWWTAERIGIALAIVLTGLLAAMAWAAALHSRVRKQTTLIQQKVERHAVLEERTRIARDLHDTLTQSLAGVAFQLEGVRGQLHNASHSVREHFAVAVNMLRHSLAEARRSVMNLRALGLEDSDLLHALEDTTRPLAADSGVTVKFSRTGLDLPIPALVEHHLLRLGQEGIANALQHAKASVVRVTLTQENAQAILEIVDDGRGFDPAQPSPPGHFGLVGMRERANLLRAKLDIISQPGHGSTVRVTVPTSQEQPAPTHV